MLSPVEGGWVCGLQQPDFGEQSLLSVVQTLTQYPLAPELRLPSPIRPTSPPLNLPPNPRDLIRKLLP